MQQKQQFKTIRKITQNGGGLYISLNAEQVKRVIDLEDEYCDIYYSDKKGLIYIRAHDERLDGLKHQSPRDHVTVRVTKLGKKKNGSIQISLFKKKFNEIIKTDKVELFISDEHKLIILREYDESKKTA